LRGGFRIDHEPSERDQWTLLGDIYGADVGQLGTEYSLTAPTSQAYTHENDLSGGDMLARWKRTFSPDSDMVLQVYYNREKRQEQIFSESLNTYDIDFQHRFPIAQRHEITWGLGYRLDQHRVDGGFNYSLNPRQEDLHL
jgi:iron complex outermembrane receptor protein